MTRVALAQVAAGEDREANLNAAIEAIRKAAQQGAALICFPEMGFDRFFPQQRADTRFFDLAEPVPGPTVQRLQAIARDAGIAIVANLFERAAPGEYYDCSPVIDADGSYLGLSRMVHIAEAPMFNEKFYYRPADGTFPVFSTRAGRVGIAICYDRHYPEQLRILALKGCEILLVPLAAVSREQWTMFEMEMQVASFQNQMFSVVVNRVGHEGEMEFVGRSFATDPYGRVIARAADGQPELLIVDLDLEEIDRARRVIPHMRDRRPELYRAVASANGAER
jgi:N-carbamoylputrescine amidase